MSNESRPREPTLEDIQCICLLIKKLTDDEASHVLYMLCEWSYASGYAKGMIGMRELINKNNNKTGE